jgi:hypothetical protein
MTYSIPFDLTEEESSLVDQMAAMSNDPQATEDTEAWLRRRMFEVFFDVAQDDVSTKLMAARLEEVNTEVRGQLDAIAAVRAARLETS